MNSPSASSLITTMMLFAVALSRAPRSSSQVISITIAEGRQVDHDRDAGDVRRRLQQAVHRRVGAEERRPVAGREPRPGASDPNPRSSVLK